MDLKESPSLSMNIKPMIVIGIYCVILSITEYPNANSLIIPNTPKDLLTKTQKFQYIQAMMVS